jgi:hypothetical protein
MFKEELMSRKRIVGFGLLVVFVGSACGMPALGGTPGAGSDEISGSPEPAEASMRPVPVNQGLASLDSYHMTYTNDVFDSLAQQRTVMTFVAARDRNADANYNRTETLVTTGENEVVSDDVQEQFVIGDVVCAVTEGEAERTTLSDTAQVFSDLMSQVVDFNPLIENPVYVGEDVVNGVPVRTYTFEVRSLGAATDVEAARADGSYAIAVDGDYLVDYRFDMELRSGQEGDPEAEYSVSSFVLSLEDINQPVEIVLPPNCEAAELSGE